MADNDTTMHSTVSAVQNSDYDVLIRGVSVNTDCKVCVKSIDPPKVKEFLKNAPEITGSEGPADIFVNIQGGHNFSTTHDCERCEYKDSLHDVVDNDGKEYQECDAPENHNCFTEYQTCIVISIQGDLRDRMKDQTQKEFDNFMKYLTTKFYVRDYSLNIGGE